MDEMLLHQLIEEVKLLREEIRLLNLKIDGGSNLKKNLIKIEKLNHIGVSETQNDTIELNNQNAAINYIMSRKMMIKNYKTDVDDDIFMKLSNYLGNRYEYLRELYAVIKPSLSNGNSFFFNMQNKPQEVITYCTQFCSLLYKNAFLSNYSYKKSSRIITGAPQRVGRVINFFTGGWLENYILNIVISELHTKGINDFSFVQNCQLELPNGDNFEVDMLFIVKDVPIWIECKTGDYQRYISKYSDFRKRMGTTKENSLLIISDLQAGLSKNLSSTFDLTAMSLSEAKLYISELIENIQNKIPREEGA
ncbi:hypothetical protein [Caloramator proteoclasticus]|uniref:Uncharacterized protein n=1 Tax=Caloramator proteoclasticus DSM 10124 TaxID=1121262 RepID=A0A1M4SD30_9CLOT|nr:hypothetical protein [Caloramator proteoclasticus]SHE30143.1 hypothetical protein SAMN02746091_00129 [Caloramator proteoclasticus DSM 10124]